MFRHTFIRLTLAALLVFLMQLPTVAAPREKDPGDPGDIRERLIRLIKKLPKPLLPKILDDYPGPPKPNPYNTRTFREGASRMGDILAVRDVVKVFGQVRAVDGVSFAVRAGTITGLLGRNGAGKTTTIRMITGIFMPDSGSVDWLGGGVGGEAFRDRVGYLPEERGLYKQMKVIEHLLSWRRSRDGGTFVRRSSAGSSDSSSSTSARPRSRNCPRATSRRFSSSDAASRP